MMSGPFLTVGVEGHRAPITTGTFTTEIRLQRKDLKGLSRLGETIFTRESGS
jgi:hypothetical protein